ncbi:MAG: phosphodiesterase, partial [Thermoplasmata archaeon]|nr:phosphodiesterase [Thermoplasmata archaeon]
EPEGILAPGAVPGLVDELRAGLSKVVRPDGQPLAAEVHTPKELYREVHGDAPDLVVYFGKLRWRSAGTMGHAGQFLSENDTGPDDSVHSFEGVYAVVPPGRAPQPGPSPTQSILDVTPTILRWYGLPLPPHLQGKPIASWL